MSIENKTKWDELINKEAEKIKKDKEYKMIIKKNEHSNWKKEPTNYDLYKAMDAKTILGRIGMIIMFISLSLFFISFLFTIVFNISLDLTLLGGIIFVISLPFLALGGLIQFDQSSNKGTFSNNSQKTEEILKKQLKEQEDFNAYQSYL